MNCRRCNTDAGVRHYADLDEPGWFCGPCHALALQMDIIELHHHALHICNPVLSEHAPTDATDGHAQRTFRPKSGPRPPRPPRPVSTPRKPKKAAGSRKR